MKRFLISMALGILPIISGCSSAKSQSANTADHKPDIIADIRQICELIPEHYVYFESRKAYWGEACLQAEIEAKALTGTKGGLAIMERLVDDLYDPHISLNTNNQNSPRLVPSGSDLWFQKDEDNFIVTAIRPNSGAAATDIAIGDILVSFNVMPPRDLADSRIHSGRADISDDRYVWAINAAIAGRRSEDRQLVLRRGQNTIAYKLGDPEPSAPLKTIDAYRPAPDIGYIRINNNLGNSATVPAFNEALKSFRDTAALILDLRDTPGGGSTDIAEPIIGRFTNKTVPYQRIVPKNEPEWTREVSPQRPWQYDKPLIILVGRWTGSMGEGMAIGFDAMGRATVMGDHMAGLAGGIEDFKLEETGVSIKFPTYDLHHLNGTPRHEWSPEPRMTADFGNNPDELLTLAIARLRDP